MTRYVARQYGPNYASLSSRPKNPVLDFYIFDRFHCWRVVFHRAVYYGKVGTAERLAQARRDWRQTFHELNDAPSSSLTQRGTSLRVMTPGPFDDPQNVSYAVGVRDLWRCHACGRPDHVSRLVIEADIGGRFPVCADWRACSDRIEARR